MYEIYLDERMLYYEGDEEHVLLDSELKENLNSAAELTIEVPWMNPEYDNIFMRSSMLRVMKDGKEKFYGEVREVEKNMDKTKQVYAVGELAFLFDTIQPQAEYHDLSPRQMLETWLNLHNSQVEERKRFYVGIVTIHDSNDRLYRYTNQETTLDAIREKLIDKLGGYLRIRKADGKRYLDYVTLADYGKRCNQPIKFGVNLLDYSENTSASELYSCVIPMGARLEESPIEALEAYTDIKSVNGGKDYLFSQEAVNRFGWNRCVVKWDDVHVPSILKEKGLKWLQDNQFEQMSLDLTALDLSILGVDIDSMELGDTVRAIASPFGMDRVFPVQSMTTYLQRPDDNKVVLGENAMKSYSQQSGDSNKQINMELGRVHEQSNFLKSAIDNANHMMTGSKGGYKITEFDENKRWLRDLYMNAPNKDNATNVMQINMNGIGFSRNGFNGPYLNAWTTDGVLMGEFIKANSIQTQSLSVEYRESVQKEIADGDTGGKAWAKQEITTSITALEGKINLSVSSVSADLKGYKTRTDATLTVMDGNIKTKVTAGQVESAIDQKADSIRLKANKISWKSTYSEMSDAGKLKCTEADISGLFKCGSAFYVKLENGRINGGFLGDQYGYIDYSASAYNVDTGQVHKGIQVQGGVFRISVNELATRSSNNVSTVAYIGGTGTMSYISQIDDLGEGSIQWWTTSVQYENGLMVSRL